MFFVLTLLTRGLDYYTGIVFETELKDYPELGLPRMIQKFFEFWLEVFGKFFVVVVKIQETLIFFYLQIP